MDFSMRHTADNFDTRKFTIAYVFFYARCAVSWKTKLHSFVTTSTNHSELVAAAMAAREAKFFGGFQVHLTHPHKHHEECQFRLIFSKTLWEWWHCHETRFRRRQQSTSRLQTSCARAGGKRRRYRCTRPYRVNGRGRAHQAAFHSNFSDWVHIVLASTALLDRVISGPLKRVRRNEAGRPTRTMFQTLEDAEGDPKFPRNLAESWTGPMGRRMSQHTPSLVRPEREALYFAHG